MIALQHIMHFNALPVLLPLPPSKAIYTQFNKETSNLKIVNSRPSSCVWYIFLNKSVERNDGGSEFIHFKRDCQDC